MCTELYNSKPGNVIKYRIRGIVAKLLLEYRENSKDLTDHLDKMMKEIKKTNVDTKLSPHFLTTMLNVLNVIHQKRDEETDEFMGEEEEEEEEETTELKPVMVAKNSRTATLGPRKLDARDEIIPKYRAKAEEVIPKPTVKKKSVLDYHSSDSEDTMRSKIPLRLDIDHNTIS